jgi:hypothetical protein
MSSRTRYSLNTIDVNNLLGTLTTVSNTGTTNLNLNVNNVSGNIGNFTTINVTNITGSVNFAGTTGPTGSAGTTGTTGPTGGGLYFSYYKNGNTTVTSSATLSSFVQIVSYAPGSDGFNTSSGIWTVVTGGVYNIVFVLKANYNSTVSGKGVTQSNIVVNGSTQSSYLFSPTRTNTNYTLTLPYTVSLSPGNTVSFSVNTNDQISVIGTAQTTYIMVNKIG